MFKLVIVEDEDNIRHSLECFIPWDELGFQVVNAFSDGSDALAWLKDNPCDAVLTDILMSRMSGLDMIGALHQIHPRIKVVILSGHSDFSYARQAIQYQVVRYLVKPVDEDELMDVFREIKKQLDEESAAHTEDKQEMKQMLQKSFFRDLLSGYVASEKELSVYLKLLDLEESILSSQLYAFEIKSAGHTREAVDMEPPSPEAICKTQLASPAEGLQIFFFEEKADCWHVVFLGAEKDKSFRKRGNECVRELVRKLNQTMPQEFTYHLTHSVARLSDLLADATRASQPVAEQQVNETLCQAVVSNYKLLMLELDLGSQDSVIHILNRLVYELKDSNLEDVRFAFKNLYSLIEQNYKKRKVNVWDITNGKFNFSHLYQGENLDAVTTSLREDFTALCEGLKNRKHKSEHNVIERIVEYIGTHLADDLGHEAIATRYRIHPGYLSRLFKQEMGETLSEYLLRMRIERAAQLLKEGQHRIGEIAGLAGFNTSSYFSLMFKKYTGYSPREYCQRVSL